MADQRIPVMDGWEATRRGPRRRWAGAVRLGMAAGALVVSAPGLSGQDPLPVSSSDPIQREDFVGAEACAECHRPQYDLWASSTHGRAGGVPGPDRVIPPFDGEAIAFAGGTFTPTVTPEGQWAFVVEQADGANYTFPVTGVIGGGHMVGGGTQGFLSAYADGTLRFLPFDYSKTSATWFCNTPGGWRPITRALRLTDCVDWPPRRVLGDASRMENCQSCHGSQISLSYDAGAASYETRLKSLRINCESCHGPGAQHVARASSGQLGDSEDIGIRALGTLGTDASLEVCFQCHAIKAPLQPEYLPGKAFEGHYSLKLPVLSSNPYLPDGRLRIFGYQLNHLASDCYLSGSMTCVDCHDPHSSTYRDVFRRPLADRFDDGQCLGCHPSKGTDLPRHTRHAADSPGSNCVACHMPYRQQPFLGDEVRFTRSDHTIAIPRPGFDETLGVVSACRLCHQDRPVAALREQTATWYGGLKPHRDLVTGLVRADSGVATALEPGDLLRPGERDPLAQVAALGRFVNRFVATEGEGRLEADVLAALRQLADGDDVDVRAVALAVLHLTRGADPDPRPVVDRAMAAVGPDADAVRMRWVAALVMFAAGFADRGDLPGAVRTLQKGLAVTPNHAISLYELALLQMRVSDWAAAESTLVRTLESAEESAANRWMVDPNRGLMLVNLGVTRERLGLSEAAAATYREAIERDPGEALAYYYLATYHHVRGELDRAVSLYQQALGLKPDLLDAYLLLATGLRDLDRIEEALAAVEGLLRLDPQNPDGLRLRDQLQRFRR